jgi:hypothetical protein
VGDVSDYAAFLAAKTHYGADDGFAPLWMPEFLFDFQRDLVEWALLKGRAAIFADCGLGKTPMQLVWAQNIVEKTNGRVLIVTPLAVSAQTLREADKFSIEAARSIDGTARHGITVTNYERLEHFDADDFAGVVCDESSILKNFDGVTKARVTEFMRMRPYRLLCTATASPNDYVELGTSAEALGVMGHLDMLGMFFRNTQNDSVTHRNNPGRWRRYADLQGQWRFKHHAEEPFWRWVCSWARALRRPSDLGFDDDGFILPPLIERATIVPCERPLGDRLFVDRAVGLREQREERRLTIEARCAAIAEKVDHDQPALVWCHLNPEGDMLEKVIPDAIQVSGSQSDEEKEERLLAFVSGEARVLVTKPRIGAFGLNLQHCAHVTFFPSHSYEQYYQGIRRCYRFGQKRPVCVDIVTTEGELNVLKNLQRKAAQADAMFSALVKHMNDELHMKRDNPFVTREEVPAWL